MHRFPRKSSTVKLRHQRLQRPALVTKLRDEGGPRQNVWRTQKKTWELRAAKVFTEVFHQPVET